MQAACFGPLALVANIFRVDRLWSPVRAVEERLIATQTGNERAVGQMVARCTWLGLWSLHAGSVPK